MSQRSRSNFIWSAVRNWCTRLGSVVVFVILARILPKEQLGLFAAATALVGFIELFSEAGIGDAIVQRPEVDDSDLTTALFMNLVFGLVLAILLLVGAPTISRVMHVEKLNGLLPYMTISLMLNASSFVPQSLMRRQSRLKTLAVRSLLATVVSGVVGIVMAVMGFGVYSLLAQLLIAALINAVYVWLPPEWSVVAAIRWSKVRSLLSFSSWLVASKVIGFLAVRSIEFFIASSIGPGALALYIMGSRICYVVAQLTTAVTTEVSFIEFSQHRGDVGKIAAFYRKANLGLVAVVIPLFGFQSALAQELTRLAFGTNGDGSALVLAGIALLCAVNVLEFLASSLLNGVGKPNLSVYVWLLKMVGILVSFAVTWHRPLPSVIDVYVVAQVVCGLPIFVLAAREAETSLWSVFAPTLPFVAAGAASYFGVLTARVAIQPLALPTITEAVLLGTIALASYACISFVIARERCAELVATFGHRLPFMKAAQRTSHV